MYKSVLTLQETNTAIKLVKDNFERKLAESLNLQRVSAPLFVTRSSGLNDDLNGHERAVSFDIKDSEEEAVIVHSLAKWKRMALKRYGFKSGSGLYTDMNAIRRDEDLDNIHSIYVDQWDWELVIEKEDRNLETLKSIVKKVVEDVFETKELVKKHFPQLKGEIKKEVFFITTQELLDMYPNLSAKERENEICKKHGTVCLMQIGGALSNGQKHDGRAPDYDDWSLNCDILFWYEPLSIAFEISSMGIRVDKEALEKQLKLANMEERKELAFHKALLNDELPLTVGGGIGQSRMCLLLLEKIHIGEVQASLWNKKTYEMCEKEGIELL